MRLMSLSPWSTVLSSRPKTIESYSFLFFLSFSEIISNLALAFYSISISPLLDSFRLFLVYFSS